MDLVSDALASGHGFRILSVVDRFTPECPALKLGANLIGASMGASILSDADNERVRDINKSGVAGITIEAFIAAALKP